MGVGMWQDETVWAEGTGHGQGSLVHHIKSWKLILKARKVTHPCAVFLLKYFSGYDNESRRTNEEGINSWQSGGRAEFTPSHTYTMCVHMCGYVHVEARGHLKYCSSGFVHFHYKTGSLTSLELAN